MKIKGNEYRPAWNTPLIMPRHRKARAKVNKIKNQEPKNPKTQNRKTQKPKPKKQNQTHKPKTQQTQTKPKTKPERLPQKPVKNEAQVSRRTPKHNAMLYDILMPHSV